MTGVFTGDVHNETGLVVDCHVSGGRSVFFKFPLVGLFHLFAKLLDLGFHLL